MKRGIKVIYVSRQNNEEICEKALLRYGKIVSDKELTGENFVRMREIILDGKKFFHCMVNGETRDIVYLGEVETYCFYFSKFQKELHQVIGKPDRYFQFANGQRVEYTQICNKRGQQCLFADAVLVAEVIGTEEEIWQKNNSFKRNEKRGEIVVVPIKI